MTKVFASGKGFAAAVACILALGACSSEKVFDNTVDGTLFVGKTAVRAVAGTAKLGAKGAGAVVRQATED